MKASPESSPLLTWDAAAKLAENCRAHGGIVVTTNGCFDLLHSGHVRYLTAARELGAMLLVAINSDESVRKIKGPERPLNNAEARATVLAALRAVDGVCVFEEPTPVEWLKRIHPNIHAKGGDWDPAKMVETPVVATWGGRTVVIPYVEGFSTTGIISKARGV